MVIYHSNLWLYACCCPFAADVDGSTLAVGDEVAIGKTLIGHCVIKFTSERAGGLAVCTWTVARQRRLRDDVLFRRHASTSS
jgi:hypothetical protein